MYLAQKKVKGKTYYVLRESYSKGDTLSFRDLFELGSDPSRFIVYPGGNAYYIDEKIEERLNVLGIQPDADTLEDMFRPFLRPDIKRAVDCFQNRSRARARRLKLGAHDIHTIRVSVHPFDKRRLHYLKFGIMDQGPVVRMPPVLFKHLLGKSRDEIEQKFIENELSLNASELKTYVYVAFNLQRFFSGFFATKMPHVLEQKRVDDLFLKEICRVNQTLFGGNDAQSATNLHDYLVRYLIMFFDHDYEKSTLLDDYVQDFIYRHRFSRPPVHEKLVNLDTASRIFGVKKENLGTMTRRSLTRLYRRLAQRYHPDKGGSNKKFIELNEAYQSLLTRMEGD